MGNIIAIDGPAGSGKGTVAGILSEQLNYQYIDTGVFYRSVAYIVLQNNILITDIDKVIEVARNLNIEFKDKRVYYNNLDITLSLRSYEVDQIVSPVSSITMVRKYVNEHIRDYAKSNNIILDGRDTTTVLFPDAQYKIYLDASLDIRAKRRYDQNISRGINTPLEEIKEMIRFRDYNDTHKEFGSLMRTDEQIYIDSSSMAISDVVKYISEIVKEDKE